MPHDPPSTKPDTLGASTINVPTALAVVGGWFVVSVGLGILLGRLLRWRVRRIP